MFMIFDFSPKVVMPSWIGICSVFGLVVLDPAFRVVLSGPNSFRYERLRTFVVVSPREVPSLSVLNEMFIKKGC